MTFSDALEIVNFKNNLFKSLNRLVSTMIKCSILVRGVPGVQGLNKICKDKTPDLVKHFFIGILIKDPF